MKWARASRTDAYEGRIELVDDDLAAGTVFGVQFAGRDYSIVGEEAFVPPTQTDSLAAFWVGQFAFDGFDVDAGVRVGRVTHDAAHLEEAEDDHHEKAEHDGEERPQGSEDFTPWSASVGIFIPTESEWAVGLPRRRLEPRTGDRGAVFLRPPPRHPDVRGW